MQGKIKFSNGGEIHIDGFSNKEEMEYTLKAFQKNDPGATIEEYKSESYSEKIARLESENATLNASLERYNNCWIWMENEENHIESMCDVLEVLIPAKIIREWHDKAEKYEIYRTAAEEGRLYIAERCCKNCDKWEKKYQKCEHPECPQSLADAYMAPEYHCCELWEVLKAESAIIEANENL